MPGYDPTMWGWGMTMMFMMPLLCIGVAALIVWLVVRLMRQEPGGHGSSGQQTAVRILEERLARGEIDLEEFRSRRAAINDAR